LTSAAAREEANHRREILDRARQRRNRPGEVAVNFLDETLGEPRDFQDPPQNPGSEAEHPSQRNANAEDRDSGSEPKSIGGGFEKHLAKEDRILPRREELGKAFQDRYFPAGSRLLVKMPALDLDFASLQKNSGLALSPSEEEELKTQLSDILSFFSELKEVDTEGVPPTFSTAGLVNKIRADKVTRRVEAKEVLATSERPKKEEGIETPSSFS